MELDTETDVGGLIHYHNNTALRVSSKRRVVKLKTLVKAVVVFFILCLL